MRRRIFIGMLLATLLNIITAGILLAVFFYYEAAALVNGMIDSSTLAVVSVILLAAAILAASYGLAFHVTRKVTDSISKIDFNAPDNIDTYDELATFVRMILRQQNQIETQMVELTEQGETIRSIFENMHEGFIMIDRFGAVVTANPRARDLFGAAPDCEGKNINYLTRNSSFLDKVKAALQGHSGQMTLDMDQVFWVSFIPSPDRGTMILIADITERQLAEKMRREFSANVSHELNTPLTTIAGFAEILSKGQANPEDTVHFSTKIRDESRRMIDMVENLFFLSELDEMEGKEAFSQFDISHIAAEAIESLAPMAKAKRIEVTLADSSCPIYGNRRLIYALFTNLVSNAIQYNKSKGWVKIAVSSRNQSAYINVTDTGIGIPKEEQTRIFERFYRVDRSRSKQKGSTGVEPSGGGLGLAIVKHIVRHHNGTIEIESEPDEGTRVFIKLPIVIQKELEPVD